MTCKAAVWAPVRALLEQGALPAAPGEPPTYPAAALAVASSDALIFEAAVGVLCSGRPERTESRTRFDVASLTKPMVVGTLAMMGLEEGWLDLDEPLGERLRDFSEAPAGACTLRQLLGHRSGLPAWLPLWEALELPPRAAAQTHEARTRMRAQIAAQALVHAPSATALYSDLGYMALGFWLEEVLQAPLGVLFQERVAGPLSLERSGYTPPPQIAAPATENCPLRGRLVRGEVHDENAWYFGAPTGHAGLFASAADVARWGAGLLQSERGLGWLSPSVVKAFWDAQFESGSGVGNEADGTWRLAFDTPSPEASSAGRLGHTGGSGKPHSVGHLGFTGCSVWIDRQRGAVVALLTNRVCPTRANERIKAFRPRLHDAVASALDQLQFGLK